MKTLTKVAKFKGGSGIPLIQSRVNKWTLYSCKYERELSGSELIATAVGIFKPGENEKMEKYEQIKHSKKVAHSRYAGSSWLGNYSKTEKLDKFVLWINLPQMICLWSNNRLFSDSLYTALWSPQSTDKGLKKELFLQDDLRFEIKLMRLVLWKSTENVWGKVHKKCVFIYRGYANVSHSCAFSLSFLRSQITDWVYKVRKCN